MINYFFRPVVYFVAYFQIQRLFFLLFFKDKIQTEILHSDLFKIIITGLRFDLMVTAYVLAPIVLIFSIRYLPMFRYFNGLIANFFTRAYLSMISIGIFLVTALDLDCFMKTGDRLTSKYIHNFQIILSNISGYEYGGLFVLATLSYFFRKRLKKWSVGHLDRFAQLGQKGPEAIHVGSFYSYLAIILIFALMARGSFDEHHLDSRHAEVTSFDFYNKIIVPSAYAFDQALRNRR